MRHENGVGLFDVIPDLPADRAGSGVHLGDRNSHLILFFNRPRHRPHDGVGHLLGPGFVLRVADLASAGLGAGHGSLDGVALLFFLRLHLDHGDLAGLRLRDHHRDLLLDVVPHRSRDGAGGGPHLGLRNTDRKRFFHRPCHRLHDGVTDFLRSRFELIVSHFPGPSLGARHGPLNRESLLALLFLHLDDLDLPRFGHDLRNHDGLLDRRRRTRLDGGRTGRAAGCARRRWRTHSGAGTTTVPPAMTAGFRGGREQADNRHQPQSAL
jgi:hypothetical protein